MARNIRTCTILRTQSQGDDALLELCTICELLRMDFDTLQIGAFPLPTASKCMSAFPCP
jgi:hypothetical protein